MQKIQPLGLGFVFFLCACVLKSLHHNTANDNNDNLGSQYI